MKFGYKPVLCLLHMPVFQKKKKRLAILEIAQDEKTLRIQDGGLSKQPNIWRAEALELKI